MCGFGDKVRVPLVSSLSLHFFSLSFRIGVLWPLPPSSKWWSDIKTTLWSTSSEPSRSLRTHPLFNDPSTSEIDWSFFLVTVDLWSADAKQEMNLVLHPSSTDRYMPAPSSKNRRRGTSTNQPSNPQTPVQPSHAPSYRPPEQVYLFPFQPVV